MVRNGMIDEKAFKAIQSERGWTEHGERQYRALIEAYEAAKRVAMTAPAEVSVEELQKPEAWPANIIAGRHEVSGKWVLWYLTDEQASVCQRALPPLAEEQCGICGNYHEGNMPRSCEAGDGE